MVSAGVCACGGKGGLHAWSPRTHAGDAFVLIVEHKREENYVAAGTGIVPPTMFTSMGPSCCCASASRSYVSIVAW